MMSTTSMRLSISSRFNVHHALRTQRLLHPKHQLKLKRPQSTYSSKPPSSSTPAPASSSTTTASTTTSTSLPILASTSGLWLYLQPITIPFRAYSNIQSRRPHLTQLLSSMIIYFLGDLSSQTIQNRGTAASSSSPQAEPGTYDPIRALRSILIGAISSLPSYHYFLWLSRSFNIPLRPYTSLTLKILFNQLTFAPLFNTYFFGMHSLLSYPPQGPQPSTALRHIRDTVPISWWNSCQFWPIVTAFSFTFVKPQFRSVFAGVVAIGWQSYLGLLNQRAARKEAEAQGGKNMVAG